MHKIIVPFLFAVLSVGIISNVDFVTNSFFAYGQTPVFSDDFESGFSKWTETGEGDWVIETPSEKQVPNHSNNLVAHSDDCDSNCVLTLAEPIDFTNYSSASLEFWRYVDEIIDDGEYLKVDIYDGNNWKTVASWTHDDGNDDTWHYETLDLKNYLDTKNFKVRFQSNPSLASEGIEVDDVLVEGKLIVGSGTTLSESSSKIIHMQDTTSSWGVKTNSDRPINAEFVSTDSELVGDKIDAITMKLRKVGSPTGTAYIGIFNEDLTAKEIFGTINPATLYNYYSEITFSLPPSQLYTIQEGDIIGIKFTGGNKSNFVHAVIDNNPDDPFDGTNSHYTYYGGTWMPFIEYDMYMILAQETPKPKDSTPPTTTASPSGGSYTSTQSVTLSTNEFATIYYTIDGSTPTTSSHVYSSPILISASSPLKFFAKDSDGNTGDVKTIYYSILSSSLPENDPFGVKMIYPTKIGGNTWFMNMANPAVDPRFDPQTKLTQNSDGSWKSKDRSSRMNVYATTEKISDDTKIPTYSRTALAEKGYMQLPSDWKNFEMTGYVKVNSGSSDDLTWYGRGGYHNDSNSGCEGSSYKANLEINGGTKFSKESYHVHYDSTKEKSGPSIMNKWVGFKFVIYNIPGNNFEEAVGMEIWVDYDNNNQWKKVNSFVDDGFGSGANHCGPALKNNMPMTWGGPIVDFRVDKSSDYDFKNLSVREIEVNK